MSEIPLLPANVYSDVTLTEKTHGELLSRAFFCRNAASLHRGVAAAHSASWVGRRPLSNKTRTSSVSVLRATSLPLRLFFRRI